MARKIVVLGGGYIGTKMADSFHVHPTTTRIIDIETAALAIGDADVVINCIGKTGVPNVDWCESHKEETYFANVCVPGFIAEAVRNNQLRGVNTKLVHLSSGCIYWGENSIGEGWGEDEKPNFEDSYYSHTKVVAERLLGSYNPLILRIRMPVTAEISDRNLITKLLKYKKIIVSENSVTPINHLVWWTNKLLEKDASGIYNCVLPEAVTHKQILELYEYVSGTKLEKHYVSKQSELGTIARRSDCVLSTRKLEAAIGPIGNTKEILKQYIMEYVNGQSN